MEDFESKAHAALKSILSTNNNPAEVLAQSLINDRPTIDVAVKAFMSLTAARNWSLFDPNVKCAKISGSTQDVLREGIFPIDDSGKKNKCFFVKSDKAKTAALLCARSLLKKINSFKLKVLDEEKDKEYYLEYEVVRTLWNGLIDNGKKPSLILGRRSLCHVYPFIVDSLRDDVPLRVDAVEAKNFMEEFGYLLNFASNIQKDNKTCEDDDSRLLWDRDRGFEELKRRRERREKSATTVKNDFNDDGDRCLANNIEGLTIEEIPEEEESTTSTANK